MRASLAEFLRLPEGTLAEFIGGEILLSPSPRLRHPRVVFRIHQAIQAFAGPRSLGEAFEAPPDVHPPSGDVLQPDVFFVTDGRKAILQDGVQGAPDLVVEVLSPETRRRDLEVKAALYLANGVLDVWLADPEAATIGVRAAVGPGRLMAGAGLTTSLLPAFLLRLDDVFAP